MSLPHSNVDASVPFVDSTSNSLVTFPTTKHIESYSREILINDWNSREIEKFPDHWEMHSDTESLLFLYFGDMESMVTRSIYVRNDMSLEVSNFKNLLAFVRINTFIAQVHPKPAF